MDQPLWGSREALSLTISEAARICGVKRRTIRRRHRAGEFEHAFKDPAGTWRIPVDDLTAAGFRPNVVADPDEPGIVFTAASPVDRLRTEVAVLRERVRALEIIAREREERVTDLRTILRMLPAARETEEPPLPQVIREEPRPFEFEEAPQVFEADKEPQVPEAEVGLQVLVAEGELQLLEDEGKSLFREDEEVASAQDVSEELIVETLGVADADPTASQLAEEEPVAPGAASPFDAPVRAAVSPWPSTEPVLILPDAPNEESGLEEEILEPSAQMLEGARQRSTELLEDAMSLWWPSPASRAQFEQPAPSSASAPREGPRADPPAGGTSAGRSTGPFEHAWFAAAGEALAPSSAVPEETDRFQGNDYDEASFDWLDSKYGRPPRHLRRRLGRFLRRHRRPR